MLGIKEEEKGRRIFSSNGERCQESLHGGSKLSMNLEEPVRIRQEEKVGKKTSGRGNSMCKVRRVFRSDSLGIVNNSLGQEQKLEGLRSDGKGPWATPRAGGSRTHHSCTAPQTGWFACLQNRTTLLWFSHFCLCFSSSRAYIFFSLLYVIRTGKINSAAS